MIIITRKIFLTISTILFVFLITSGCYLFNLPPVIESEPITNAKVGSLYTYEVEASDPDNNTLTYSLLNPPSGMNINSTTGVISWTPASEGSFEVIVEVSDGRTTDTQTFTITVTEPQLTSIEVLPSSMTIYAGQNKAISSITAYYDDGSSEELAFSDCVYSSTNSKVTVSNGTVYVSSTCSATTATVTVSYTENEITKSDTIAITVKTTGGG
ncbi:MAG: hypothetical protein Kow00103_09750 [Candidatus Caldatribacteriota bacterium]